MCCKTSKWQKSMSNCQQASLSVCQLLDSYICIILSLWSNSEFLPLLISFNPKTSASFDCNHPKEHITLRFEQAAGEAAGGREAAQGQDAGVGGRRRGRPGRLGVQEPRARGEGQGRGARQGAQAGSHARRAGALPVLALDIHAMKHVLPVLASSVTLHVACHVAHDAKNLHGTGY